MCWWPYGLLFLASVKLNCMLFFIEWCENDIISHHMPTSCSWVTDTHCIYCSWEIYFTCVHRDDLASDWFFKWISPQVRSFSKANQPHLKYKWWRSGGDHDYYTVIKITFTMEAFLLLTLSCDVTQTCEVWWLEQAHHHLVTWTIKNSWCCSSADWMLHTSWCFTFYPLEVTVRSNPSKQNVIQHSFSNA